MDSVAQNYTFRWGIIGCGKIAEKFADDLNIYVPNATLHAVASRDLAKAKDFAEKYKATHAFGSYEEMIQSGLIDVVYIATPHAQHHENTLMCLEAGVPVLCEKAFAINTQMVQEMIAKSQEKNLFLMEAIWTRFHPAINQVEAIIKAGTIGEIKHIAADFGFLAQYDENARLFNPALTGGSLYDIGIYPLFISKLLLGKPSEVKAVATFAPTGVDMNCAVALAFPSGATASLYSTLAAETETTCIIYGTKGKIAISGRFHETFSFTLKLAGEEPQVFQTERNGYGYSYEAIDVQRCLTEGRIENDRLPLQFSLELMELMCEIRSQIGLKYPQEA
ncbi:Gfo/Idh/MocA family protein [Arcicella rosea]|uniref:Putative dehydrogenase n=1 Tax=Arcicella rosea TaxID=502909 RepID=A0A841EMK0_9BACT|nr:Gfo/Idh/MocA family oxidoreductase [Arcicella rosea]MBB6003424.1 putative dehydrogenase [Arcicella rosea]